jgi:hypothetical protein
MAHNLLIEQGGIERGTYTSGPAQNNDGQTRTLFCWGTFAEAMVSLQYAPAPEGPWFDDKTGESTFRENDIRTVRFAAGLWIRGVIVGATANTRVNLVVF